jgi:organic hydroperoxide reductase OsmC/OhrA
MKSGYRGLHARLINRSRTLPQDDLAVDRSGAHIHGYRGGSGMEGKRFHVTLSRRAGFDFAARFENETWPAITLDEPPPLGEDQGPNASRVLGAAVGHCLASSLLFCLGKARVPVDGTDVTVDGTVERNEQGRLRITELRVKITPTVPAGDQERMQRCLGIFEDFCTVTGSVRKGISVHVEVSPTAGT